MTTPKCPGLAAGAVSLRKSHDIVILSFCNIVKGQANSIHIDGGVLVLYLPMYLLGILANKFSQYKIS